MNCSGQQLHNHHERHISELALYLFGRNVDMRLEWLVGATEVVLEASWLGTF